MSKIEEQYGEDQIVRPVMPELDTVRGIAVLMVCIYHGFQALIPPGPKLPHWERLILSVVGLGWAGVNLFFVLSGFLITGILLDSANKPRYYSRFYSRRALRILPAYYLLIVVLLLVSKLRFVTYHTSWAFAVLSFVYLSNITPLLGVPRDYQPLWSLAVEEHFYLIWPTAVRALTRRSLVIAAALICVGELFARAFAVARGGLWWGPYTWLSADGLALGALLAIFARSHWNSRGNLLRLASISALVTAVGLTASLAVPRFLAITLRATFVNYAFLSILSAVLWLGTGRYRNLVNVRLLSFYGFISYGLYLVHEMILHMYSDVSMKFAPSFNPGLSFGNCLLQLLTTLAIGTAVAWISRTTYEEYFLRMKGKRDKQKKKQVRTLNLDENPGLPIPE
jgi:peptidoglycan/LPS O-acetylase OafA/YrhL